jgi:hypothetical protein
VPLCLLQIPQKLDWSGIRGLKPTLNNHTDIDCILILFKEIIAVISNNNNKNTHKYTVWAKFKIPESIPNPQVIHINILRERAVA